MTKSLMAGFHLGVGGNQTGIGDLYYKKLAALGIPFVIMAADAFPAEAQELALAAPGVRNFVGYRRSTPKPDAGGPAVPPSGDPNVPRFGISAQQASEEHWAWHTAAHILPPEYDGRATYLLTINEPEQRRRRLCRVAGRRRVVHLPEGAGGRVPVRGIRLVRWHA
ncbi:MAG: hypothetical protein IPK53_03635 [bacterium]|nr:hypothetical protein [bacterium]